jgi:UDP-glucose 4-epimerase
MRVLVTGGAGYIGSHTLVELLGQGTRRSRRQLRQQLARALDRVRELTNG